MSSPRVSAVQKFIDAFGKLDKETIISNITPNFTYTFAPSTVSISPLLNPEAFSRHLDNIQALLKAYPITVKTIIDCGDVENKVVLWATGDAQFKDELMDDGLSKEEWQYKGEYIVVFTIAESGKLEEIFEFMDSKAAEKFRPLMQRAGMNLQKLTK